MKKALFSAAAFAVVAVSSIAIAPTTSEAIPAFARQTGAACLSCHFQTFPAINSFGRAFKMGAFTDVGDQALIEDDNLSLPSVLNLGYVLRAKYSNQRVSTTGPVATVSTTTKWAVPTDSNLLIAGRVGSNTGAFVEFAGGAGNFQLMNSFDFGSFKGGLNIANTGFGPTAALEVSNVFGQHSGKLEGANLSAVNNIIGSVGQTTSIAGWVGSEMGIIQVAAVAFADARAVNNNSFVPTVRAILTTEFAGADVLLGFGIMTGTQTAGVIAPAVGVNANFIDLQLQGELGEMSYGLYADFVTTKAKSANNALGSNAFAGGLNAKRDGYSIRLDLEPLPRFLIGVGAASDKTTPTGGAAIVKTTQSQFAGSYSVYQNMEVIASYNVTRTNTTGVAGTSEVKTMLIDVEALF